MISPDVLSRLREHAARDFPRECCGVVIAGAGGQRYVPCRNAAQGNDNFAIHPADYAAAEDAGEVIAIAHSHCSIPAVPSQADRVGCERSGLPWIIVGHPAGGVSELSPQGYRAPLLGREFCHGVLDCYTLIRDYYAETLALALPDFDREDDWWDRGGDLYLEHFGDAGFIAVETSALQAHDVILMQVRAPVANHAGIYLGGNHMLHHFHGRLSARTVYGGWYQKCTRLVVRHRSLIA